MFNVETLEVAKQRQSGAVQDSPSLPERNKIVHAVNVTSWHINHPFS